MDELELRKLQVEAWKTTIEVQQHFNDIEMRIRALAITLLTAVLGAAALAVRSGTTLHVRGIRIDLGGALVLVGLLGWMLFYFVDYRWYHRLLVGSVKHGKLIERLLEEGGVPGFGLTTAIGDASPYPFRIRLTKKKILWETEVHSAAKIRVFYFVIAGILVIAAVFLFTNRVTPATSKQKTHSRTPTTVTTATVTTTTTP